jgi:hypothetical protein
MYMWCGNKLKKKKPPCKMVFRVSREWKTTGILQGTTSVENVTEVIGINSSTQLNLDPNLFAAV